MDESARTTFKLSRPIKDIDGTEVHQLRLREPVMRDLTKMDANDNLYTQMVTLMGCCSGMLEDELMKLPVPDVMPVFDWLNDFLAPGAAPIGPTPSG